MVQVSVVVVSCSSRSWLTKTQVAVRAKQGRLDKMGRNQKTKKKKKKRGASVTQRGRIKREERNSHFNGDRGAPSTSGGQAKHLQVQRRQRKRAHHSSAGAHGPWCDYSCSRQQGRESGGCELESCPGAPGCPCGEGKG